jgi:N-acetylglucosaminyl-diphospho-decaprenol L-rhamnosyltransferase
MEMRDNVGNGDMESLPESVEVLSILEGVSSRLDASICILNWNGSKLLADCLQSLTDIRHLNHIHYEIIVIDNGSTDDSVEMLRRQFPEVRLVTIPKNISISAATNEGLRLGIGRYSLILNNDIVLQGDCLDQMVKFLDQNPKAGIAGGRLLNPDGSTQTNYYPDRLPSVTSICADLFWLNRLLRRSASGEMPGWDQNISCRMEQVPGACMMVRGEVFKEIGFWDDGFTCWYEDVDFCCRCLKAGWEIWYLPEAKVTHFGGSTFRELGMSQKALWRFHGLLRYSRKHFSWPRYSLVRLLVLLTLLLRLPIVTLLSFWPPKERRRAWKGIIPAYFKLIAKLSD